MCRAARRSGPDRRCSRARIHFPRWNDMLREALAVLTLVSHTEDIIVIEKNDCGRDSGRTVQGGIGASGR
jgi:hypothetical protein